MFITIACGNSYTYGPPPDTFSDTDLVGTWQAKYGGTSIDTIVLKADGTYQQIFQSPSDNDYYYESPWNKWYVEPSPSGKPTLYLEGMRYYGYGIKLGESGGRDSDGEPAIFFDIDEKRNVTMLDKVILRIEGNDHFPKGIVLWHMHFDLDASPAYFVFVED